MTQELMPPNEGGDNDRRSKAEVSKGSTSPPKSRNIGDAQVVPLARFVLIPLAARATGYSERAIHKKIDDGVWRCGLEWRKAPDGRRLIDMQAVETWIAGLAH